MAAATTKKRLTKKEKEELAAKKAAREAMKAERERKKALKAAEAEEKARKKAEREAKKAKKEADKLAKENAKLEAEKNAKDVAIVAKALKIKKAFYPDKKDVDFIQKIFAEKTNENVDLERKIVLQVWKNREICLYENEGDEWFFRLDTDVYFFNRKTNFVMSFGPIYECECNKDNRPWGYEKYLLKKTASTKKQKENKDGKEIRVTEKDDTAGSRKVSRKRKVS